MLGIFLVAFYVKRAGGTVVFWSALVAEVGVIALFAWTQVGFLWLNAVGALGVILLALMGSVLLQKKTLTPP